MQENSHWSKVGCVHQCENMALRPAGSIHTAHHCDMLRIALQPVRRYVLQKRSYSYGLFFHDASFKMTYTF